jgi:argininosuccinate lyase
MSNLSRVAADFIEWSTKEFGYLEISDEYSSSSSIMPQKKNPSTIELLRGKTSVSYGALLELLTMVKGVPTGYYQDLQQTKISLWNTLDICQSSLDIITGVVRTVKFDEERMLKVTEGSYVYALELCEALVEETELNFREAYNTTATLVKRFTINNQNLKDVTPKVIEEITSETVGRPIIVDQRLINDVFDPHQALKRRKSLGSPNPEMVNKFISIKKRESQEKYAYLNGEKEKIRGSLNRLNEIVSSFTS